MQLILTCVGIVSFCFGILIGWSFKLNKPDGIFHIDTSDEAKDVYKLELLIPLTEVDMRRELILAVRKDA